MDGQSQKAVKQVLSEAARHEPFFDLSDAERLTWMIGRAFVLGTRAAAGVAPPSAVHERRADTRGSKRRRP